MAVSVLVFAKEPLPGRVKTRLVPPLTAAEAAELASAFLADLLDRLDTLQGVEVLVAVPDGSSTKRWRALLGQTRRCVRQGEGTLGDRILRTTKIEFDRGAAGVLVIGGDHPNLPLEMVARTLRRVSRGGFAWIPTEDGGYAAIGLPRSEERLFRDIPWSTSEVARVTRERALESGIEIEASGTWYDVDRSEDLKRLGSDLERSADCPRTSAFLATWQTSRGRLGIAPSAPDPREVEP